MSRAAKRAWSLCFLGLILLSRVFSDDIYVLGLEAFTPRVQAMGQAVTALSSGYNSFFANPASFGQQESRGLTLLSLQTQVYAHEEARMELLQRYVLDELAVPDVTDPSNPLLQFFLRELPGNGLGNRSTAGIGLIGPGLGLGLFVDASLFARGSTLFNTSSQLDVTYGAVVGLAFPISVFGIPMSLGGSLKPLVKSYGNLPLIDLLTLGSGSEDYPDSFTVLSGFGIGLDFGAQMTLGPMHLGLSLLDIGGTRYAMERYNLAQWIQNGGLPLAGGQKVDDVYLSPMRLSVGAAYDPDLGALEYLFSPRAAFDVTIPFRGQPNFFDPDRLFAQTPSFLAMTHMGLEASVMRLLHLRGGLNQGYLTLGFGVDLWFAEINFAVFAEELGLFAGDQRRAAASLEVALRFGD